jgi:hypothetical protein
MRTAPIILLLATACTPEIVAGSYLCGPDASCPEEQVCSELDNRCVLPSLAMAWECESDLASEPDDTVETAYPLTNLDCETLPIVIDACMGPDDSGDWVQFTPPANCSAIVVDARITFPIAFQRIGIELVDVSTGMSLATDTACEFQGESGDELRCLAGTLTPGTTYAIHAAPTGDGDCAGDCAFNRYTLRIQLATPQ